MHQNGLLSCAVSSYFYDGMQELSYFLCCLGKYHVHVATFRKYYLGDLVNVCLSVCILSETANVCLSFCLFVCPSMFLPVCLSLSVCLPVCQSFCLQVCPFIYHLSTGLSVGLPVCLPACLSAFLSVFVCLDLSIDALC